MPYSASGIRKLMCGCRKFVSVCLAERRFEGIVCLGIVNNWERDYVGDEYVGRFHEGKKRRRRKRRKKRRRRKRHEMTMIRRKTKMNKKEGKKLEDEGKIKKKGRKKTRKRNEK